MKAFNPAGDLGTRVAREARRCPMPMVEIGITGGAAPWAGRCAFPTIHIERQLSEQST
jgi:hypothetical protein